MQSTKSSKTSAPYGQACVHCVKVKSRCMLRSEGSCERCHRLDKECVPSATVRKRSVKQTKVSKRAQLEDKLDDLVTLLRTQQVVPPHESSVVQQIITPSSLSFSPQQTGPTLPCDSSLTDHDLAEFRVLHLPCFPLVYLPPSLSARQLLQEKPMLALAIKTISNKAGMQQVELSERLRSRLALKLMVDGEKSLDILLSMLVCMAWSVYFTSGKRFLVMFSNIAKSLASDLRIDKPRFLSWCPSIAPTCEEEIELSNESRRTLLGCYASTAIISMTFKGDIMGWSPQLEESCAKLALEAETEGDEILVAIVRISRICLQATEVYRYLSDNNGGYVAMHTEPLKNKLVEVRATLSDRLKRHDTVVTYLFAAEIAIHELAILHPPTYSSAFAPVLDHKRTDYLMACLYACQDWAKCYLSSDLITTTTAAGLLFSYCLTTLHKLTTLQDSMWNIALVRQSVNVVELLEHCADMAEKSNAKLKEQTGEESVFLRAAGTLREMVPNWRKAVAQEFQVGGEASIEPMDPSMFDFSGDFWLNVPFNM